MSAWHKYGAKRTEHAGRSFASKLEAAVYQMLRMLELAKEIVILGAQTEVRLSDAEIVYKPDFVIRDLRLDEQVWVEAKGYRTPEWQIKKRLWRAYGPGRLRIYEGSHRSFKLTEEIVPKNLLEGT